jgi:Ca-activated chloride channel family protein
MQPWRSAGLFPIFALLVVGPARGQNPQPSPPVFKADIDLVTLTATVVDRDGRPVVNLRKEDFRILEDGTSQDISFFQIGEELPLTLAIAIDTSGSMVDKIDDVGDAVEHLLRRAKPEDEVFLLQFSDEVELLVESAAPADRDLGRRIGDLQARGSTALYDAVVEGLEAAQRGKHRKKVLLVVTDGNDTSSGIGRHQAMDAARGAEVLVYCLGIGHGERGSFGHGPLGHPDRVDIDTLMDLAAPSGGRAYLLEESHRGGVDLIDNAVAEIGQELRQQYTLGYYPNISFADRSYRRIKVETANPALNARTRKGYWAPASKKQQGGPSIAPQ